MNKVNIGGYLTCHWVEEGQSRQTDTPAPVLCNNNASEALLHDKFCQEKPFNSSRNRKGETLYQRNYS